jgi:hypothetical protein
VERPIQSLAHDGHSLAGNALGARLPRLLHAFSEEVIDGIDGRWRVCDIQTRRVRNDLCLAQLRFGWLADNEQKLGSLTAQANGRIGLQLGFRDALTVDEGAIGAVQVADMESTGAIDGHMMKRDGGGAWPLNDQLIVGRAANPDSAFRNEKTDTERGAGLR